MENIFTDQPNIARILLETGANVNAPNEDGKTPLHFAAEFSE